MQNLYDELSSNESSPLHRIGGVAQLAGVPVTTLRVWESRHGAFSPAKSAGSQRLYTQEDATRARLLRQLTEAGHRIGGIARLTLAQLQALLADARFAQARDLAPRVARHVGTAVVGTELAARVSRRDWLQRHGGAALDVRHVFADMAEALEGAAHAAKGSADLLLARVNALTPDACTRLRALAQALGARHVVVLYSYGPGASIAGLRDTGFMLRREPVEDAELAQLVRSVSYVDTRQAIPAAASGEAIPPPRYSDVLLARVAASSNRLLCECPRHLAEILRQLANFEDYSAACLNESVDDAQLHAQLRSVAGTARVLFEQALAMTAIHAGLPLEEAR
jgi:DNA-binding transcriptional MerR regulator